MTDSRLYCPEEEFTGRLRSRLPMNVLFSFTGEQLQALRKAFGTRFERRHRIDLRRALHLPWGRYYIVVQLGADRRVDPRRSRGAAWMRMLADTLAVCSILAGSAAGLGWLLMQVL